MVTSYIRNTRCGVFALGVATAVLIICGVFVHQTTNFSSLLLARFANCTQTLEVPHKATPETEDPMWGAWDRKWRPPGDDEDWGKVNCTVPSLRNHSDYYEYIDRQQIKCNKVVQMGGVLKPGEPYLIGEKWVCADSRFKITPGRCLALSFGIANDFSFDDYMDKVFNCKVHAFDHTIGTPTHRRSPNVMFHSLGIAATDKNPKLARYVTILKKLKLENAIIDYLKIDVELAERQFFSDVFKNTPNLLKNVKQIGMEVHSMNGADRETLWKYFGLLRCYGFKIVFTEINPVKEIRFKLHNKTRSCCYEVVWAREKQW